MAIAVGDKIPEVTLRKKGAEGIDALQKGRHLWLARRLYADVNGSTAARLRAERRQH